MVPNDMRRAREPVARQPGEDAPLVGDLGREDDVERGDAVGRDEQEPFVVQRVELADLAASNVHCFRH